MATAGTLVAGVCWASANSINSNNPRHDAS
jgi:hypothetical protein